MSDIFNLNVNQLTTKGNVGIGTSSPQVQLVMLGAASTYNFTAGSDPLANLAIINDNNISGTGPAIVLGSIYSGSSTVANARIFAERQSTGATNAGATDLIFEVGQASGSALAERLRIDSGGSVGIGTDAPSASAILDAQSTTKGVRMPNMTTTQKNAIASPAAGLMVYDTTLAKLCVYTTAWETITSL